MHKNLLDTAGLGVFLAWIVNSFIPVIQPIVMFLGAVGSLVWLGWRFHDRIKYGPSLGDKD